MEKEVLECVLKKSSTDGNIKRIISVEKSSAVGKFQNFMSDVYRLNLKVILKNGRSANRSLIIKDDAGGSGIAKDYQKKYSVFMVETLMYTTVLKELEYLMEEMEDREGTLWCKFIHHIPYSCIILEDLKPGGYVMVDRNDFFDLEHSCLALHNLGRYHGMMKAMEQRGIINKDSWKPWYACNDYQMHNVWAQEAQMMVQGIKKHWDAKWSPLVDRIQVSSENLHKRLKKVGEIDETKFNVVGHGDCNKNNFMFKYDWKQRPISVKFLDFQIPYYGTPSIDLSIMIFMSTDPFVRRGNMQILLETYYTSLSKTLELYGFTGEKPSFQEIQDRLEDARFLSLWYFLMCYPSMSQSEKMDEFYDFEKLNETQGKEGYNIGIYKSKLLEEAMGPDLEKLITEFF